MRQVPILNYFFCETEVSFGTYPIVNNVHQHLDGVVSIREHRDNAVKFGRHVDIAATLKVQTIKMAKTILLCENASNILL